MIAGQLPHSNWHQSPPFTGCTGQQRRNCSGYHMSPYVTLMQQTKHCLHNHNTIHHSSVFVLMRLNVCLSCRFPLTPHSLMTITALRWWQYSLYSAQYTHWGSESKNSHRSIPLSLSHLTRQSSPSIIWLGNATRTQNTSTPKCFIIVMLSSWGRYNNSFFDVDFSRCLLFWRSDDKIFSFPLFFYSSRTEG